MLKCTVVRQNPVTTRPSALQTARERERERERKENKRSKRRNTTNIKTSHCCEWSFLWLQRKRRDLSFSMGTVAQAEELSSAQPIRAQPHWGPGDSLCLKFPVTEYTSTTSTTRIANVGTSDIGTEECQTQLGDLRSKNGLIWPCCPVLLYSGDT